METAMNYLPTRKVSGSDRHVYLINVTADQPLSENGTARGGVGGGLTVIRYSNTC